MEPVVKPHKKIIRNKRKYRYDMSSELRAAYERIDEEREKDKEYQKRKDDMLKQLLSLNGLSLNRKLKRIADENKNTTPHGNTQDNMAHPHNWQGKDYHIKCMKHQIKHIYDNLPSTQHHSLGRELIDVMMVEVREQDEKRKTELFIEILECDKQMDTLNKNKKGNLNILTQIYKMSGEDIDKRLKSYPSMSKTSDA